MLTLDEAKKWLSIDEDDDFRDDDINDLLLSSQADILESAGVPPTFLDNVPEEMKEIIDSQYRMCQRIYVSDNFYERDTDNKALNSKYTKLELSYERCKLS